MPTVGQTIRAARLEKRLTQEELAKRVGVTRVAVSEWERDLTLPRVDKARKIAALLQLDESELTPLGGGVSLKKRDEPGVRGVPLRWSDVPMLEGIDRQPWATNGASEAERESRYLLEIEDDSMLPEFAPGDTIAINPHVEPWDGCTVVAHSADKTSGVLRNYRVRMHGGIDLWPNSPHYQTETIVNRARIVGVVVSHERHFKPPV